MKAIETAEAMLFGKVAGAAVNRFRDIEREESLPVLLQVGFDLLVFGPRHSRFASEPSERRAGLRVGDDRSRNEKGGTDEPTDPV